MTLGAPRRAPAGASESNGAETRGEHRTESGVRPATRGPSEPSAEGPLISALVATRSGRVLEGPDSAAGGKLRDFCGALPELFGPRELSSTLSFRGLDAAAKAQLRDLVLVSPTHVHVAHRHPQDPELAVLSVADRNQSIGWIVSEARARLARF
jgi:hypothetical protein